VRTDISYPMSIFEVQDCCCEINRHLSLVQLLTVQKYRLWYTKPISIRNLIIARLTELGYDLDGATGVINAVQSTKSVISGSFLLAVLIIPLDEPLSWPPEVPNGSCNINIYRSTPCAPKLSRRDLQSRLIISPFITENFLESVSFIKETILRSWVDDGTYNTSTLHDFDALNIAYNGHALFIKGLECILTTIPSLNYIELGHFDYNDVRLIKLSMPIVNSFCYTTNQTTHDHTSSDDDMPELV
jgi:hypothetical protein